MLKWYICIHWCEISPNLALKHVLFVRFVFWELKHKAQNTQKGNIYAF